MTDARRKLNYEELRSAVPLYEGRISWMDYPKARVLVRRYSELPYDLKEMADGHISELALSGAWDKAEKFDMPGLGRGTLRSHLRTAMDVIARSGVFD